MAINLVLRSTKGSQLTAAEADANLTALKDAVTVAMNNSGVTTVNGRTGSIVLSSSDITTALGYTPSSAAIPALVSGKFLSSDGTTLSWSDAALNSASDVQINSLGVGTPASGTTGEIRATNDVIAGYSDERLKTVIGPISDALNKVKQLVGITYIPNATAVAFGLVERQQVGVIAQSVQRVLPEAIARAPFDVTTNDISKTGEDYLTVRYDRLVPLLIEAIKQLSDKLDELK